MNCNKIEELYIDFILDLIGPNIEREQERNTNLEVVTNIIRDTLNKKFTNFNTYIFHYGSFPMKAYLKNADIDITIFLQSRENKTIMKEMPLELINNIILIIKDEFERYNKNSHFGLFSEIKLILADIRLLKCKIHSLSLDISINNFSGIYKVIFISYIEKLLKNGFKKMNLFIDNAYVDNKIQIFRRTLILIKGWCSFEGNLMGSNIGLMASYALEILVMYVFNLHYENINNEFDGFQKFFEVMDKIDWENSIISLFGIFQSSNFLKILDNYNTLNTKNKSGNKNNNNNQIINEPFWYLDKKINLNKININEDDTVYEPLIKLNELKNLIAPINKGMGNIYLFKEGNIINGTNFGKLINILDPLNNHNNLGKSISYHSKAKMKKIISYMNKQLKYIKERRKEGNPFLYMNCLLNLFKITLSTTYIDLFIKYMNSPRLIANSSLVKKPINIIDTNDNKDKNNEQKKEKEKEIEFKEEILKFNKLFTKNKIGPNLEDFDEEENDKYVEENENEESDDDEDKLGKKKFKEKLDFDCNYNEDEYAENEDEEYVDGSNENNNSNKNENKKCDKEIKFVRLINDEIIKKIFEINNSKQKIIKFNNDLLDDAINYSNNLEKFLKENKLI